LLLISQQWKIRYLQSATNYPLLTVSNGLSVAKLAMESPLLILATDKSVASFVNQQRILRC